MTQPDETIESVLKETVLDTPGRVAAEALTRAVCQRCRATRRQVRTALGALVRSGELAYTYELGVSFVVPSMNRPVRVSPRLVLCPENISFVPSAGERVVFLAAGAAFGSGAHPTTRLALAGLDRAMAERAAPGSKQERLSVLDIGTGSGVLVIAALLLGAGRGLGTDIDPCALAEAKANVAVNNLTHRIRIENRGLETMSEQFGLVLANLRLPTLVALAQNLIRCMAAGGDLVVSGLRSEEAPELIRHYGAAGFELCWRKDAGGWAGMGFRFASSAERGKSDPAG